MGAVVLDGLLAETRPTLDVPAGASTAEALVAHLQALMDLLSDERLGGLVSELTARAQGDPAVAAAMRDQWFAQRRGAAADLIHQGIRAGDLRPDLNVQLALDQLFAPTYHRALYGYDPIDESTAVEQVGAFLRGAARRDR